MSLQEIQQQKALTDYLSAASGMKGGMGKWGIDLVF
jgi:hypothetical protein